MSVVAAFLAATLAVDGGVAWKSVDGGNFTVSFPADPTPSERNDATQVGNIKSTVWDLKLEHETFTLSIAEYAPEVVKKLSPAQMIEGARDGAIANAGGSLEKDQVVFLTEGKKKWPGREFTMRPPGAPDAGTQVWSVSCRMYLVDNRLFALIYTHDQTLNDADFAKFADSLSLRPAPSSKPVAEKKKK